MGNSHSKKNKDRPSVIRPVDINNTPDNEYSNTTATSINSILISHKENSYKTPVNEYPFPNSIEDHENNNYHDEHQDTVTSMNEMSLSSQNQLTVTSMRSFGKNLDIDECINRLLDVGTCSKITKSICFKNSEIVAICRAAQEVFLSQPVSTECFVESWVRVCLHNQTMHT